MTGLSVLRREVLDVFYHGQYEKAPGGPKKMIKQYSNHETGLCFVQGQHGRYKVTTVWKRGRR